jgi:hypothetical protein
MAKLSTSVKFFREHAAFSFDPKTETKEAGRTRSAQNLAAAEGIAREAGYAFEWQVSDIDSADFSDSRPTWKLYDCIMHDATGHVVRSLAACDFGRNASGPYGDYRRVVEAELAAEELADILRTL